MKIKKHKRNSKGGTVLSSSDLMDGFTAEQVIEDRQRLKNFLSQPRAVLFLIRELLESVPGSEYHVAYVDSGINTLTFLIGDKQTKLLKSTKSL